MPLQNRVLPNSEIVASPHRGQMMGNRGGRIHDPQTRELHRTKRWSSRQWICCRTEFNNRQRQVMGSGYTELFFLDEVTAFASGHRPCFECRRNDFLDFAERWRKVARRRKRLTAKQMDDTLHEERLSEGQKRVHRLFWDELPDGAMIAHDGGAVAKFDGAPLLWTTTGYESLEKDLFEDRLVSCLTPPSILAVLKHGYSPQWHVKTEKTPLQV